MKKYAGLFFSLLVMQSVQGMNLAKEEKPYNPTDEQCRMVALYLSLPRNKEKRGAFESCDKDSFRNPLAIEKTRRFLEDTDNAIDFLKSIPGIRGCSLDERTKALSENTRSIAGELSRANVFVFVTYNRDFFTAMCHACLPEKYEDRAGFFSETSNAEARVFDSNNPPVYPVLSRKEMIELLKKFPLDKALYAFSFVNIPKSPLSKPIYNRVLINDSSCKSSTELKIIPPMDYQWTYEDCEDLTAKQRAYLDAAVHGLNDTDWENDNRLVITDQIMRVFNSKTNVEDFNPVQDFILKNEKYGSQRIKVDITPSTRWEKFLNKVLCMVPHGLVMIIPDLIQSQTNDVYDSMKGIALCAAGSLGFGQFVYPVIDSYNSDVRKFSQWYGPKNYKKTRVGREFIWISVISSLAHVTAQKFVSWQALPWKILGGGIHVVRAFLSCIALSNIEDFYNTKRDRRNLNEEGVPFTMKDLANGSKFTKQQ